MTYQQSMDTEGFAIIEQVIDGDSLTKLQHQLEAVQSTEAVRRRNGSTFGIRNMLNLVPFVRSVLETDRLRALVTLLSGERARVVRGLFFDKTVAANWKVYWHQDLTIAVRERREVDGFGPWSVKAGIPHVQPPTPVLENILTLRIHLDDTNEANGALRLIARSHNKGKLTAEEIRSLATNRQPTVCRTLAGGIIAMRPLLIHSSASCAAPGHRRVIHLEFSSAELPGGLEWYGS